MPTPTNIILEIGHVADDGFRNICAAAGCRVVNVSGWHPNYAQEVTASADAIKLAYSATLSPLAAQWQPLLQHLGIMLVIHNGGWQRGAAALLPNLPPENPPLTVSADIPPVKTPENSPTSAVVFIPQFSIANPQPENTHEQPKRRKHRRVKRRKPKPNPPLGDKTPAHP